MVVAEPLELDRVSDAELDDALVRVVLTHLESLLDDPYSSERLSEVGADLLSAVTAFGVIGNGGHRFWYQGKNRQQTLRAALGFERMGLPAAANALRSSLGVFPDGQPTVAFLDAHGDEWDEALAAADEAIWDVDFDAAAAGYIRSKRAELVEQHPALATHLSVH